LLPRAMVSAKRIDEVVRLEPSIKDPENPEEPKEAGTVVFNDVSFAYPDASAPSIAHISFEAKQGQTVAFIGATGSGKTTLVQHLCGLLKPDSGKILADGININEKSDKARAMKRKIGLLFQYPEYQLFEETILKDVYFGPLNLGCTEEEAKNRAEKALELVGMDVQAIGDKSPFALSGGQKRRVAIAGILAMQPEFLILDEPAAGLDPEGKKNILNCIKEIKKQRQIGILLISHNMDDVAEMAERIIVMHRGNLVMDDVPEKVFMQREALHRMGLSAPSFSEFMEKLKALGLPVETNCLSLQAAASEILRVYNYGN